jgi:hypothetical protein
MSWAIYHSGYANNLEVSATNNTRDELWGVVRDHLADKVSLFEFDYWPSQK